MTDPKVFEQEVRRIARYRWHTTAYSGSEMLSGKERDGVFITEECVHLVECTCLGTKEKALKDLEKLFHANNEYRLRHPDKAVKCWFVTLNDPTGEQAACRKLIKGAPENLFNIVSFAQFQAKLIDSHQYLQLRDFLASGAIHQLLMNRVPSWI